MHLDPNRFTAGETMEWTLSLADYPADEWTLKLAASSADGYFASTADASGTNHVLTISASASSAFTAGTYRYQLTVEKGADATLERHLVEAGDLVVDQLLSGAAAVDARTSWQKILDDLESAYQDFVSTGALRNSYSIGDRSIAFASHEEIREAIRNARVEVQREKRRDRLDAGLPGAVKIYTRFRS